ncbi:MAG: hypothetical protein KC731_39270 [Myxococcales bacterium]|nr:hypothetical protein [Myxococcales bacterium]
MRKLGWPAMALMTLAAACGGDDGNTGSGGSGANDCPNCGGAGGGEPVVSERINIMADTNRDGVVDDADNLGEELWTVEKGASFLPNYDDDNGDGVRDAETQQMDLGEDELDLAPLVMQAWPEAPDGTVGRMSINPEAMPHVRLHRKMGEGSWVHVGGAEGTNLLELSTEDIRAGVTFGVEGLRLVGVPEAVDTGWNGIVQFDFVMYDGPDLANVITTPDQPTGFDTVQMRVAPWIMFGNMTPNLDTIFSNTPMQTFVQGIDAASMQEGVTYWKINNWPDHWTEDWMQTGFVSVPAANGAVHGMRLANPRPWGRQNVDSALPIRWLENNHIGADMGYFVVYRQPHTGDSYDSHGNHDLIPAYKNDANGQDFPYGRIIHGSGLLSETKAFYESQLVQAPALTLDTSWLIVGHIDEVFSYVPANTERGWKLMVGSPDLAVQMLTQWETDGHGAEIMFQGKTWSNNQSAAISISDALSDTNLMSWSQQGQSEIDAILAIFKQETGMTDDEIIEIPFLFERDFGALVAYNPGTVNSFVAADYIMIPDPWGPKINGTDGFRQDLQTRLTDPASQLGSDGQGLTVYFVDDWDWYHALLGEVHCGTNYSGPPQPEIQWWTAAQ